MNKSYRLCAAMVFIAPLLASAQQPAVPASQAAPQSEPQNPALIHRPAPPPASVAADMNRVQLDVVVTDAKGDPVSGLTPQDFTLLDDKHPVPIVSFHSYDGHAYDGAGHKPNPPVHVILVLDTVNQDFRQVAFAREQLGKFFQENGGHLAQPVSLYLYSNDGVSGQRASSTDGNAEAAELSQIDAHLRTITQAAGVYGAIERFQLSLRALTSIAQTEAKRPGRKLLIWIGPGWPLLSGPGFGQPSVREQQQNFDLIVAFSTKLRESQTTLYSVSSGDLSADSYYYHSYLKGVRSPRDEDNGSLNVKVLAIQSGGLVLGPTNDLTDQLDKCVRDASAYYVISFDRPRVDKTDEYHDLKVQVARPKLTARTSTGYYNQLPGQPLP
jgi:VWFA-related protein